MQSYVAGLDGGGTKTALSVWFGDNSTVRACFGPLNSNGNPEAVVAETMADVAAYLQVLPGGLAACRAVCVGGAGISNRNVQAFLQQQWAKVGGGLPLQLVGDHETALTGALLGDDGLVLIAGTGSICYGRSGKATARSGGFGHLIDDEGSGYAIGRDLLTAVVRAADGRAPATCLSAAVFAAISAAELRDLVSFVYAPDTGKAQIAALARLLPAAVAAGDAAAVAIADRAAAELAALAGAVIDKLVLQQGKLVLLGSILQHHTAIADGTRRLLLGRYPQLQVVQPQGDAADGAALLARRMAANLPPPEEK